MIPLTDKCKLTLPHQDAEGSGGRPKPVLQRQVVMAMVRVLCPPEGDAVRRQDGGGAHRHQGETRDSGDVVINSFPI